MANLEFLVSHGTTMRFLEKCNSLMLLNMPLAAIPAVAVSGAEALIIDKENFLWQLHGNIKLKYLIQQYSKK